MYIGAWVASICLAKYKRKWVPVYPCYCCHGNLINIYCILYKDGITSMEFACFLYNLHNWHDKHVAYIPICTVNMFRTVTVYICRVGTLLQSIHSYYASKTGVAANKDLKLYSKYFTLPWQQINSFHSRYWIPTVQRKAGTHSVQYVQHTVQGTPYT
jgi:hypothetical protein